MKVLIAFEACEPRRQKYSQSNKTRSRCNYS